MVLGAFMDGAGNGAGHRPRQGNGVKAGHRLEQVGS